MSNEWDNLILLDAARPDYLLAADPFEDATERTTAISPATYSYGFMQSVFDSGQYHDTVYITANPYNHRLSDSVFYRRINLLEDYWDEQRQTVTPGTVVKQAIKAAAEYPDKRLIVHFMQPHFPFLGPTGSETNGGIGRNADNGGVGSHPWNAQRSGVGAGAKTLRQAFFENHEIVVPHVRHLLEKLNGRSVITADHANLVGERGFPIPIRHWGHPKQFPHPSLVKVPWIVFDGDRRSVTAGEPESHSQPTEEIVENRLTALGYTDA